MFQVYLCHLHVLKSFKQGFQIHIVDMSRSTLFTSKGEFTQYPFFYVFASP